MKQRILTYQGASLALFSLDVNEFLNNGWTVVPGSLVITSIIPSPTDNAQFYGCIVIQK